MVPFSVCWAPISVRASRWTTGISASMPTPSSRSIRSRPHIRAPFALGNHRWLLNCNAWDLALRVCCCNTKKIIAITHRHWIVGVLDLPVRHSWATCPVWYYSSYRRIYYTRAKWASASQGSVVESRSANNAAGVDPLRRCLCPNNRS